MLREALREQLVNVRPSSPAAELERSVNRARYSTSDTLERKNATRSSPFGSRRSMTFFEPAICGVVVCGPVVDDIHQPIDGWSPAFHPVNDESRMLG